MLISSSLLNREKNKRFELLFPPPAAFDLFFIKNRFEIASSKDDAALAGVSSPLGGSGELLDIVHGDHKLGLFPFLFSTRKIKR